MKKFGLGKLVMLSALVCSLSSCQEEEFYEKDYIDSAIEQYERNTVEEDDLLEQINDEDLNQGIAESGGNNGGSGSGDGGSGSGGSGSGDGGSGTGGNVGSGGNGSGGNGSGGNGSGGSGSGGSDPVIVSKSNSFTQQGSKAPIDILWVVDNSGSMADEQAALANNFSVFINDFVQKDIDFKMAITTTDRNRGVLARTPEEIAVMNSLTYTAMKANESKFIEDFKREIQVGIRGYGIEKGLKSSEVWTDVYSNFFLRENAYFIIVYVTDERDQSEKEVAEHLAQIAKWKNNAGHIKAYSIVDMDNLVSTGYILKGYDRYKEMSDLTGGYIANINDDFHTVLGNMGGSIANLADQFPLSDKPYTEDSIEVKVNGVITVEWDYNASTNTIKFHQTAIPTDGSTITVSYDAQE